MKRIAEYPLVKTPTMSDSLLPALQFSLDRVGELSTKTRGDLLHFLLRWEAHADALACLERVKSRAFSVQILRVRALRGAGRADEAMTLMQQVLRTRNTVEFCVLYGHCLLDAGHADTALKQARVLTERANPPPDSWGLLGDACVACKQWEDAEAAYHDYQRAAPKDPLPLIRLAQLYLQRNQPVSAAAYAVRAYSAAETRTQGRTVESLQPQRELFLALEDRNRLADVDRQLEARFRTEVTELREGLRTEEANDPAPDDPPATARAAPRPASPLPELSHISVSSAERSALEKGVRKHFGFSTLLPAQAEIMASARRGENVLAILPTGAGKSLCYQLPAFLDGGLTLVISPLIALMKDQVDNLPPALRKRAVAINSSLDGDQLQAAMDKMARGQYRLVYAAPERLRQASFLHALRRAGLNRLVLDEAHCVSMWGHDFRPDYLHVAQAHRDLGAPPILALTATAPPQVRQDIRRQLFLESDNGRSGNGGSSNGGSKNPLRVIVTDTYRANLNLSAIYVRNKEEKREHLLALCRELARTGSGVVYARSRQQCEELADELRRLGLNAAAYHAGLAKRAVLQDRFKRNEVQIIVATIAFGMGVDKSDIRFIIHYGLPNSVEAYYQEAGRAGRDGQPARCVLLHSRGDETLLTRFARQGAISAEFLRHAYKVVRDRLTQQNPAVIAPADLASALRSDETQARVALGMLEEVGLLRRHRDVPRTVTLRELRAEASRKLDRFARRVGLREGGRITRAYVELAEAGGIATTRLEEQLLAWQEQGALRYESRGRDLLLTLSPGDEGVSRRVHSLLDKYATVQQGRVTELVDFARTQRCRHGHLAGYLGGQPRTGCQACDNCAEGLSVHVSGDAEGDLPADDEQLRWILTALDEGGWGRRNLMRLLRGDRDANGRAQSSSAFGSLGFRSERSLDELIDRLLHGGYIREKQLDHGGVALGITQAGRRVLRNENEIPV